MIRITLQSLRCERLGDSGGQVSILKLAGTEATPLAGPLTLAESPAEARVAALTETAELAAGDQLILRDGSGAQIGEAYTPPADPDAPYPWFRRGAAGAGALFTLTLAIEPVAEAEAGPAEGCGAGGEADDDAEACVPREAPATLAVPSDEVRDWPKYTTVQLVDSGRVNSEGHPIREGVVHLYRPTGRRGTLSALTSRETMRYYRLTRREITTEELPDPDYRRYLRTAHAPVLFFPATWGRRTTLRLPVSWLEGAPGQARTLRFDPERADPRWTFTIFNLESTADYLPQPLWLPCLERTLMRIPVEHLRWTRLRGVYLNFTVGAPMDNGNVASGGSNMPNNDITSGVRVEREVLALVCCSYAALNRAWAGRGPQPTRPRSEQAIDDAFRVRDLIFDTILHEFGHVVDVSDPVAHGDFSGAPAGSAEQERTHRQAIAAALSQGPAWDAYRLAIAYRGSTDGPGEGLAEGYRMRLSGEQLGGGEAGEAVARLMDAAGFPTLESVRRVHEQIADYAARGVDHRVRGEAPAEGTAPAAAGATDLGAPPAAE